MNTLNRRQVNEYVYHIPGKNPLTGDRNNIRTHMKGNALCSTALVSEIVTSYGRLKTHGFTLESY